MGELAETFNAMQETKKRQHKVNKEFNYNLLSKSDIPFHSPSSECLCIRTEVVRADFYPSSGKWKDCADSKIYFGGAKSFIGWYKNKEALQDK